MAKQVDIIINMIDKTGGATKGAIGSFKNLAGTLAPVGAALAAVGAAIKAAADEYAQAELAGAQLNAVLKSTGNGAGMSRAELDKLASSLQSVSGVSDETIMKGEALLLTFTKVGKDIFPGATEAALNMSMAMGTDLQSSIIQVGKALQDPIQGVSALRRVGVQLTSQQEDQIKGFMEINDIASAQKIILSELETQFGGIAREMGDTTVGATNKLKNSWSDLLEIIGEKPATEWAAFADDLSFIIDKISQTAVGMETLGTKGEKTTRILRGIVTLGLSEVFRAGKEKLHEYVDEMQAAESRAANMGAIFRRSKDDIAGMSDALDTASESTSENSDKLRTAAEVNEQFLDTLGNVEKAYTTYNDKVAEVNQNFAEGKITIEEQQSALSGLAGEYESAKNKIILSILEMKYASDGWTDAELGAYLAIGQGMGEFSEEMVNETKTILRSADAIEARFTSLANKSQREVEPALDGLTESQRDTARGLQRDLAPALADVMSQLQRLPPTGTGWEYFFNIYTTGKVPVINMGGGNAGGDTSVPFNAQASGGELDAGAVTLVGDAPGGGFTPYTEAIVNGYVFDAKTTREMMRAGLFRGGARSRWGGGPIPSLDGEIIGIPNLPTNDGIDIVTGTGGGGRAGSTSTTTSTTADTSSVTTSSIAAVVENVVQPAVTETVAEVVASLISAQIAQQAIAAQAQIVAMTDKFDEMITVLKNENPRAIGENVGGQISRLV